MKHFFFEIPAEDETAEATEAPDDTAPAPAAQTAFGGTWPRYVVSRHRPFAERRCGVCHDAEQGNQPLAPVKRERIIGNSPNMRPCFDLLAQAAALLRHPNIVGVHEVGRDGDTVYIVTDLMSRNGTLVNGKPIRKQLLKHGDMLALGSLNLKFIDEQALALGGTRILLQEDEI